MHLGSHMHTGIALLVTRSVRILSKLLGITGNNRFRATYKAQKAVTEGSNMALLSTRYT